MSRAFFATAWSSWAEECDPELIWGGVEIMGVMPSKIDPAAIAAADDLASELEQAHGKSLEMIFESAMDLAGPRGHRSDSAEYFGHYCAMEAMGEGVGLSDHFGREVREYVKAYSVSIEFSHFDLS